MPDLAAAAAMADNRSQARSFLHIEDNRLASATALTKNITVHTLPATTRP
jgi:hypothetical protein